MTLQTLRPEVAATESAETNVEGRMHFPASVRAREVYTSVERIRFTPLRVMARAARGPLAFWGLRAYFMACQLLAKKEAPYQNRIITVCVEPSEDVG